MKVPEYLLSTPRLVLLIMTLGFVVGTFYGVFDNQMYIAAYSTVLGYFFGMRGQEKRGEDGEVKN